MFMSTKTLSAIGVGLSLSGFMAVVSPASAQGVTHDPAAVKSGIYTVEPQHTQIEFAISHLGLTSYYGRFSDATGNLTLDQQNPAADKLDMSVPVTTVSTTSKKLNEELLGREWFDATQFPQIMFHTSAVRPTGPDAADIDGTLTLHGVSAPLTLHAKFVGAGINPISGKYTVGFEGYGQLQRSAFGMTTYLPMVGDEVKLTISGAFERTE